MPAENPWRTAREGSPPSSSAASEVAEVGTDEKLYNPVNISTRRTRRPKGRVGQLS
jgi:hypothetical protein